MSEFDIRWRGWIGADNEDGREQHAGGIGFVAHQSICEYERRQYNVRHAHMLFDPRCRANHGTSAAPARPTMWFKQFTMMCQL